MSLVFSAVGIIGAGQMGRGIAQVSALSGAKVILLDVNDELLQGAMQRIADSMGRRISEEDKIAALERISCTMDYASFADCDMVIEAASEDEVLKKQILAKLSSHVKEGTLLASNTSSISITRLASATENPENFCGVHFMNPVIKMPLVELIRFLGTSDTTYEKFKEFAESQLGKVTCLSQDSAGFLVNRILLPTINEAICALHEGVGTIEAIDTAMTVGLNHPMGALRLADYIGLDTCLSIMKILHRDLGGSKYRPCPLLEEYVESGWLGVKSGRGFYSYPIAS